MNSSFCHSPRNDAIALLLLSAVSCGPQHAEASGGAPAADNRPPLVRVAPVVARKVRQQIETTGYLESEHQVTVRSEVPGRVVDVLVDEGATVVEGQLLARLDDRQAAAAVRQVELQVEDRKVRVGLQALEIEASARRERQAQIERNRAKADLERLEAQGKDSVSRRALDDARFALDSAEEALTVSGYNLSKAKLDKKAAENAILELQARLQEMTLQLAEHKVTAPFDGVISQRWIVGGETITSASQLFDVVDLRNLVAYLSRPQDELALVRSAEQVLFVPDAIRDREFAATIDLLNPVVDRDSGHFKVRMRVQRDDTDVLRPGMFIRARILTEDWREALMVPKTAVLAEGQRSIVFAVRDGIAQQVVLDPGLEEQLYIECRNRGDGGLEPDDVVITAGHEDLADQTVVEVSKG